MKLQQAGELIDDIRKDMNVQEMDKKRIEEAQKNAPKYTKDMIVKALADIFDIQERALIQFIVLGDIAKACKENNIQGANEIELALRGSACTYEVTSLFKTWMFEKTDYGYIYYFTPPLQWQIKVPVKIYVYKNKFKLFDSPNTIWGGVDQVSIPNPFDDYWKIRHLVKSKLEKGIPLSTEKL